MIRRRNMRAKIKWTKMNVSSAFFTRSQLCFLLFFIILFLFQVSAVWATCELCMLLKYKSFATSFLGLLNYVSFFVFVYTEYCQTYMWNVDGYMWRFFVCYSMTFFLRKNFYCCSLLYARAFWGIFILLALWKQFRCLILRLINAIYIHKRSYIHLHM